jgi:hypothetical protein
MRQPLPRPRAWSRAVTLVVATTAVVAGLLLPSSALAGTQLGVNLITNPGAEEDAGATSFGCNAVPCPDPPAFDPPAQWTINGNFTSIRYSVVGAPAPPPGGGNNFFSGGYRSELPTPNTATQAIIVSSLATQIDASTIQADLAAQLAGYSGESASPRVTANFYSGTSCSGTTLGSTSVTITQAERNLTFLSRSSSARLPVGTRLICVVMEPDGSITDYGDIYFDNLDLRLTEVAPPPTTTPPPTTPPTTTPPTTPPPTTTPPPNVDVNVNINIATSIQTSIATGFPVPSPAIPATTDVNYNPQSGQFYIRVQYKIREKPLRKLCKKGCAARLEIRTRTGDRLFRTVIVTGGLPGDGALLGSRAGLRAKTGPKVRFDVPINKGRLQDLDFTTVGGFRVGETRIRVWLRTPLGVAQTVRDGRIRVSIARIQSGALPGLQSILR